MLLDNRKLKQHARQLRSNMTDAESRLWARLRGKQLLGVQFYRQKPLGNFIVDFYAAKAHLVVEVDGGQHFESTQRLADAERTAMLSGMGLQVLRFTNTEVLGNTDAVVEKILRAVAVALRNPTPPAAPVSGWFRDTHLFACHQLQCAARQGVPQ